MDLEIWLDQAEVLHAWQDRIVGQEEVRLASSADVALVLIALATIDRIATLVPRYCDLHSSRPSPPRIVHAVE